MTKITNLKRQGYKSRSSLKRKLETAAKADKKRIRLENEGEEHFLNCLLQETMFANIRKCVKCMSNVISATEIDQDHEMVANGSIQIENLQVHRRSGKLWLCKFCSEKDKSVSKEKSNIFVMKATEAGGNILYIPKGRLQKIKTSYLVTLSQLLFTHTHSRLKVTPFNSDKVVFLRPIHS